MDSLVTEPSAAVSAIVDAGSVVVCAKKESYI